LSCVDFGRERKRRYGRNLMVKNGKAGEMGKEHTSLKGGNVAGFG
jgi:hypothetical protein